MLCLWRLLSEMPIINISLNCDLDIIVFITISFFHSNHI